MNHLKNNYNLNIILYGSVLVTLALTPMFNSDSLIIPKMILLFALGAYTLPKIIENYKYLFRNKKMRLLLLLATIFVLQMIISMFRSSAPIEQQLFGRTGRGLGLITYLSLIVIMLASAIFVNKSSFKNFLFCLLISAQITSLYSLLQRIGFDIFEWETKTNGIIGTLGNPNFQGSFAAMALIPTVVYFWRKGSSQLYAVGFGLILLLTIIVCQSTQGYIAALASISIYFLIYTWYRVKSLFYILLFPFFFGVFLALAGMLDKGPLAAYLYKISVQSRGEMWRTALNTANNNPLFGVGLDSFGDFSLFYRDQKTANGIAEFTDNAHNFFFQFAATAGYPLALVYLAIILLSFFSFIKLQRENGAFDKNFTAIFSAWLCFQLQSVISPASISTLMWNFIICGMVIGLSAQRNSESKGYKSEPNSFIKVFSYIFLLLSFTITFPLFNTDRLALNSVRTGNGNLAIEAAKSYPESVIRYARIGSLLLQSGLNLQALDIGRSAVKFNPNAVSAWALILVNENASSAERQKAKYEILRLDPFNKDVQKFNF